MSDIKKCPNCGKVQFLIKGQVECVFCHQLLEEKKIEMPDFFKNIFNNFNDNNFDNQGK